MNKIALFTFFIGMLSFNSYSIAGESLNYEPAIVQLEGNVSTETFWGPPNYGEGKHDQKVNVAVITLNSAINVLPGKNMADDDPDNEVEENVDKLQIVNYKSAVKIRGCYKITGTLMHQISAEHYTPVLIVMNSYEKSTGCK